MNCKLIGTFIQHLEIELLPAETFYAERGAMIYYEAGIEAESVMQGRGIAGVIGAHFSGESIFTVAYINRSSMSRKLVVGSGHGLIPIKLEGMELICRRGAYVASNNLVEVSTKLSITGLVGGMGFMLQRIRGNGTVFVETKGQPIILQLNHGQTAMLDEGHIVALHGIPEDRIQAKWALKNLLRGEGLSLLQVTGSGTIYLSPGKFNVVANS